MTQKISDKCSAPVLKLYGRYRGAHAGVLGPILTLGACLEPWLLDGSLGWYDRDLQARAGDLVLVEDQVAGAVRWRTKHLEQLNGHWWIVSNVMSVPLRGSVVGPLVASLEYPGWPHPMPNDAELLNEQNADVKRALAEHFESARRRQGLSARLGC
jgi:hypothetical protein